VRAVNLIPADTRRRLGAPGQSGGLAYVLVGLLAAAVLLVLVAVLTSNTIAERQARVGRLQREAAAARALAARLAPYTEFEQLAQQRAATVREIAAARFDWHAVLAQLARVVPPGTSLQSLTGTVAPGAGSGGGSGSAGSLRADIANPALELSGCTRSQDDVARLISRLRLMSGVTRVSLADSQVSSQSASGASTAGAGAGGCPAGSPSFDLVVFFTPLPGAGPAGLTPASGAGATPASGTGATAANGAAGATAASGTGATAASGAAGSPSTAATSSAPSAGSAPTSSVGGASGGSAAPSAAPSGAG
jgi:Tfp pilus assembly protein PilN